MNPTIVDEDPYSPPQHDSDSAVKEQIPRRYASPLGLIALIIGIGFGIWVFVVARSINSFVLIISGWVVIPYLVFWLASNRVSTTAAKIVLAFILASLAAVGLWVLDSMDEDAQGALVLFFGPAYQIVALVPAMFVVWVVEKLTADR